jgi:hypothetical protein
MITQFSLRLIFGMSFVWCVMPRREVTSGFFRIQMLVTLGLAVLAALGTGQIPETAGEYSPVLDRNSIRIIGGLIALLSFFGSVMWTLERRAAGTRYAFAIALASGVTAILASVSHEQLQTLHGNLYWLSEITTALVSGTTVGGMLLGHWYLTAPSMTTTPLNRVNLWLGGVAGVKLLLGSVTVACWPLISAQTKVIAQWNSTYAIWLSLTLLGGIFGPLAVCWMVHRILKYKNTQSATGVLFVGVILAFLGEMTGALLRRELQLPV